MVKRECEPSIYDSLTIGNHVGAGLSMSSTLNLSWRPCFDEMVLRRHVWLPMFKFQKKRFLNLKLRAKG